MNNINKSKKIYSYPIPFNDNSTVITNFPSDLQYLRHNAINIINNTIAATNKNITNNHNTNRQTNHEIADLSNWNMLMD